jgi:outer membrane receptor protein involved in Fe transport
MTVPTEGSLARDIRLSVSALRMEEITVTADAVGRARGELGTASVIESDAIQQLTATSLAQVLQLVPGVQAAAPGLDNVEQFALRSVPTSSSRFAASADAGVTRTSADLASFGTLIILDGIPLSNNANLQTLGPRGGSGLQFTTSAGGGIDLRQIPAATIERVEVIRGLPSVRYGDLTQGAVIVETRAAPVLPVIEGLFDERTLEGSAVGGRSFGGPGAAGTFTLDVARTRTQPGVSDDESTRISAQLAHRAAIGRRGDGPGSEPRLSLDTRVDFFQLIDDRPENPNVRPEREFRSRDRGFRVSERARLRLGGDARLSFAGTVTAVDQSSFSRTPKVSGFQPFTARTSEGREEGFFIGGPYTARVELDGTPWLAYSRIEWEDRAGWFGTDHSLIAGAELRREWNRGPGFQFDPQFPSQVSFNGVRGYDRPRSYDEVPALVTSGFYAGDRLSASIGGVPLNIQAGLRLDLLHEGESWFSGVRDQLFQPRVAAEFQPRPWLRLRGAWGRTAKVPALQDLFPAPQYFDLVNVNFFANDPVERLAVLTTFIRDPTNPDLGLSTGTKAEIGLEVGWGKTAISLVAFRDRIDGAVGIAADPAFILRDHFALTDSITGNGIKPDIILPPLFTDTVPVLIDRPGNIFDMVNRGLELTATLPEIASIGTRLYVTGSWIETETTSGALFFGTRERFSNFQLSQTRARSPYWQGLTEKAERLLFLYRIIHHQPRLGLVATLTVQHNARDGIEDILSRDTLAFEGYVTRAGELVPVPEGERGNPEFADLRVPRTGGTLSLRGAAPDWFASFQVSKTLPLDGELRVWAFNFLDRRGRPFEADRLSRRYGPVRFGLEVTLPTAGLFNR